MNYKESKEILEEIKKAKKVMLSCHQGADPDSIVSCLLVKRVLEGMNISSDIFTPEPLHSFLRTLSGTNFGMVMVEYEKNQFKISIRSRTHDYPTLGLLEILGGGGHRDGGGAAIKDMSFDKATKKLLETAREFAKQ